MKTIDRIYQVALTQLHGIGPVRAKLLLSKFSELSEIFNSSLHHLEVKTGITRSLLQGLNRDHAINIAKRQVSYCEKNDVKMLFFTEAGYPQRLRQCADAPMMLYYQGNIDFNSTRIISVVGTRNMTYYGVQICEELIEIIKNQNIAVVSGMAYGVDIKIHRLCVKHGIPTFGVLGHGLDQIYPSTHTQTARRMLKNGGLISEFLIGTKPDRENFPMRNRIVAGLCDALIVVESKVKGGSMITARLALDYNREVFAFPGSIHQPYSEGCNHLIANHGAQLISGGEDLLKWMNWMHKEQVVQQSLFQEYSAEENQIIDLLKHAPEGLSLDQLTEQADIPVQQVSVQMFSLEMKNVVKFVPGKGYLISSKIVVG